MENLLGLLSKWRDFLINNFKHINANRNPILIVISIILGIVIVSVGLGLEEKGKSKLCIVIGSIIVLVNLIQIIYKKYI